MSPLHDDPEFLPISGRALPRFAGISTFFRLPHHADVAGADVAILGIPLDSATTYRPGARFAPRAIREASCMGRGWQTGTRSDIFRELKLCDAGDVNAMPLDLQRAFHNIQERVGEVLKAGALPLSVGGDHSVTLPILRAYKQHAEESPHLRGRGPLAIIHVDAHLDTYPPAWDVDFHHGTPFRHIVEEGLAEPRDIIQVGIRGPLASAEDMAFGEKHGLEVVMVDEVYERGAHAVAERFKRLQGRPVYVSFDIDGLDPAFAPGTGTPVPGGLTTHHAQVLLRALAGHHLVGMDLVEVSPPSDHAGITSLVAVTLMQEWLGALAASRRGGTAQNR